MSPLGWSILLLVLGLVFLVAEFFIPSGGALAVICALSFLAAIVVGFIAGLWTGTIVLLVICLVVPAAAAASVRWWPDTPIGRLVLIQRPRSSDEVLPETIAYRGLKDLIGRRGKSKGLMVPSGAVIIEGKTYDAVSEGLPIEPQQSIIVIGVSTQRLIVRPDNTIQAQLVTDPPLQPVPNPNEPLIADIPDPFAE
jgi:membrane-bound serine protease (ClpP class)